MNDSDLCELALRLAVESGFGKQWAKRYPELLTNLVRLARQTAFEEMVLQAKSAKEGK